MNSAGGPRARSCSLLLLSPRKLNLLFNFEIKISAFQHLPLPPSSPPPALLQVWVRHHGPALPGLCSPGFEVPSPPLPNSNNAD